MMRRSRQATERTGTVRSLAIAGAATTTLALTLLATGGLITPQPKMGEPIQGLTPDEMAMFLVGQSEFATPFSVEDGLGPIFNEVACGSCHNSPLGGPGSARVTRFGRFDQGVFDPLANLGGPLLQAFALEGMCVEEIPPEANVVIERATPGAKEAARRLRERDAESRHLMQTLQSRDDELQHAAADAQKLEQDVATNGTETTHGLV